MIDKKVVEHIAHLARVEINEEEKGFLGQQLSQILGYIDQLRELDVDGVDPYRGVFSQENVLREDKVSPFSDRDSIIANMPL